ncbi:MAG: pyridoxamine 5'-phosphate oxidase [Longimicrobiales bacterium]|nr:pyridoxamine 5'-phosphate oxidase [Longimicrobiales bacterium]
MSIKSSIKTVVTLGKGLAGGIPEADADRDPIELFQEWYAAAEESGILHPEAMALATADAEGRPSVRMVLLKQVDQDGFVFFTNYESRKARELDDNPRAALCFHWAVHERQVRVTGGVERVGEEESFDYFRTRGRGSRIGAWASLQSRTLDSRETLEARVREMKERFEGDEVPLPPYWGGYRLRPETLEFWQGRADRLHDRLVFQRDGEEWTTERLYP